MPCDHSSPRTVRPGDRVRLEVPHSEVRMHMRVAGRMMDACATQGRFPYGAYEPERVGRPTRDSPYGS